MPYNRIIRKAGKLSFLLVCLFLCAGCGQKKAVFSAGAVPHAEEMTEALTHAEAAVTAESDGSRSAAEAVKSRETEKDGNTAGLVDINTADAVGLMTLPGIGEVRAEAIISYRRDYGNFKDIRDIMKVRGIKEGIFSKISSLICVK